MEMVAEAVKQDIVAVQEMMPLPNGTASATHQAAAIQTVNRCVAADTAGRVTWMHVAEAALAAVSVESNPAVLLTDLARLQAVTTTWIAQLVKELDEKENG